MENTSGKNGGDGGNRTRVRKGRDADILQCVSGWFILGLCAPRTGMDRIGPVTTMSSATQCPGRGTIPLLCALMSPRERFIRTAAYAASANSWFAVLVLPLFTRPAAPRHAVCVAPSSRRSPSSPLVKKRKNRNEVYGRSGDCQPVVSFFFRNIRRGRI